MLNQLSAYIHRQTHKRLLIGLLAGLAIVVALLPVLYTFFPAGTRVPALDAPEWQSSEQVQDILQAWGPQVRNLQVWFHLTWDIAFPVLMLLCSALLISWFTQKAWPADSPLQKLNLLSLGVVFDLLENGCIVLLIARFPDISPTLALLKSLFSILKYGFLILISITLVVSIVKAYQNK